jgi:hypothetical protein
VSDGLHRFRLSDPAFPDVVVLMAVPHEDDHWGVFAPLRRTVWGTLIREVSGEAMAHARHGFLSPLMREIGPDPKNVARMVPDDAGMCALTVGGACAGASPKCRPGKGLPDCYQPPGVDPEVQELVAKVALAWRDGCYVLVVAGDEFALL